MKMLADFVLIVHFLWVLAILLPIPLIWIGSRRNWRWIRSAPFRIIHLGMIGVVILESILGIVCPLTVWEDLLRKGTRHSGSYGGSSFIGYWVGRILFYEFPGWVFLVVYLCVGFVILALYFRIPPRRRED